MHVQLPQKDLELAASVVSNLADRGAGPMPVLGYLLIDANEQGVQFRGTDNEAYVSVSCGANVRKPGRATVPADTFRELIKLMPPMGEVDMEEQNGKIDIQCETNQYKLMTLPATEFPDWPSVPGEARFQIAQKTLKNLIDASAYALPTKDHRRVLLGVFFELGDHQLRLTATDGKKLARISAPVPEVEGTQTASIVVPRKLLDNLSKFLGNEGPVEVELCGMEGGRGQARQIVFRFGNIVYRGNGIEGKYPDCDAVIPKEFPIQIDFNRDVFLTASKRAGVVTDDKNKSIILKFDNNACHFHSMAHDLGTFSGKISMDYTGPTIELAFNFQFLNETLGRFSSPELNMLIKNATAPVVFKSRQEETRLSLLMPIKLADLRPAAVGAGDDDEEA